jgi:predicted dinucleotide-binding enzyme
MKIAILGSGNVGGTLAAGWAAKEHLVAIAARNPKSDKAVSAATAAKAQVMSIADGVKWAEVVLLATPWAAVPDALAAAGDWTGKILLDATNPLKPQLAGLELGTTTSGGERVAELARGARVVKVFNTIGAPNMADGDGLSMLMAGDDPAAKAAAATLAREVGFEPVDLGPLKEARLLEPFALVWITLAYKQGFGPNFGLTVRKR